MTTSNGNYIEDDDREAERSIRWAETVVASGDLVWKIAGAFILLLIVAALLLLYLVNAITDKLALTLVLVENAVIVLSVAAGFLAFALVYLRGNLKAIMYQNKATQEQNRDTHTALISIAQTMNEQAAQNTQLTSQFATIAAQLMTGKPVQNPLLSSGATAPRTFWMNEKPPDADTVKLLTADGRVMEWSADLVEHFLLNQFPSVSRDRFWRRDKNKFRRTGAFISSAKESPLVESGDTFTWRPGVTREQVIDWYQDVTGRVIVNR